MLTGPPPKFHGTWDILGSPLRSASHNKMSVKVGECLS